MSGKHPASVKKEAWRLRQDGRSLREISDELEVPYDTVKRWSQKWGREAERAVRKAREEIMAQAETQVSIERHTLDHLLALREQYNALKQMIIDTPVNTLEPKDAIAIFRELRETVMASAKLEGIEPRQDERLPFGITLDIKQLLEDEDTAELITRILEKQYVHSLPEAQPCAPGDDGE